MDRPIDHKETNEHDAVRFPFLAPTGSNRRWWDETLLPFADRKVPVMVVGDGDALVGTYFGPIHPGADGTPDGWVRDPKPVAEAVAQLEAYAEGDLAEFDLPLRPRGTDFQVQVWTALVQIPYGVTTTYGRIATDLGRPTGSRAVGSAVGSNPIGIVIPCHRVIGANGALTGYAGGLENKIALLQLEGVTAL